MDKSQNVDSKDQSPSKINREDSNLNSGDKRNEDQYANDFQHTASWGTLFI